MLTASDFARLQREQYRHDKRNHADIQCLSKSERLKHYGLHFCKYTGRLARGDEETISFERTVVDTFLVALSASNTLHQDLRADPPKPNRFRSNSAALYGLADASGRFADACEKIDHLEEFLEIAKNANRDIIEWVLCQAHNNNIPLGEITVQRREQLALRQFYIED